MNGTSRGSIVGILTFVLQYTCGKLIKVIDEGLLVKNKGVTTRRNDMSSGSAKVWSGYVRRLRSHPMGISELNTVYRRFLDNHRQFCFLS